MGEPIEFQTGLVPVQDVVPLVLFWLFHWREGHRNKWLLEHLLVWVHDHD
jgi:hypothetical protein